VSAVDIEQAFLRDIGEHADDDAPRLAYADWLQEQPDEAPRARGEYIALQCAVARDEARGAHRGECKKRSRKLLREYRDAWLDGVRFIVFEAEFRRGFLDRVMLSGDQHSGESFLGIARELFRREPAIRHLRLQGRSLEAQAESPRLPVDLLRLPERPRLTTLALQDNGVGVEALRELVALPAITQLRRLFLGGNPLGSAGVIVLTRSAWVRGLEALDLWRTSVLDGGVAALASSDQLGALQFLDLSGNGIGVHGVAGLTHSRRLPSLRTLHLRDADLTRAHIETFRDSAVAGQLRRLDLSNNHLDDEAVAPLLDPSVLPNLAELRLLGCPVTHEGVQGLRTRFGAGLDY
jgi:uncharacterized protein (TIGR02996 family)